MLFRNKHSNISLSVTPTNICFPENFCRGILLINCRLRLFEDFLGKMETRRNGSEINETQKRKSCHLPEKNFVL